MQVSRLLPALEWLSVERGRMRQGGTLTLLRPIGGLLDYNVSPQVALQSSSPSDLIDAPCANLSVGRVLVGGAFCVPQVPVP